MTNPNSSINDLDIDNSIYLSASAFKHKGGWISDPQFMEQMGSSYLIAHGLGVAVSDAHTQFTAPAEGLYNIFVRTRNWTAYWTDKPSAGRFGIEIDGQPLETLFGNGASQWHWQSGGAIALTKGEHTLTLHDTDGFDGRCDAIFMTTTNYQPDSALETVFALRGKLMSIPSTPEHRGTFDFVVVGGGVAGMCAAIAAARGGVKVALVQDRKVLGGNNSSEIRVGLGGRLNIGKNPSLGYLLNEFGPSNKGNARPAEIYEDDKKMQAILSEENITLLSGYKLTAVNKSDPHTIASIVATNIDDYHTISLTSRLYADCSGDGALGVLAGAEWDMGRDAKSKYDEPSAPVEADGTTLGASVQWYCLETDSPMSFPDIEWGLPITEATVQKVRRGQWYWEVGMKEDQMADAERIRDYGMYVAYSNWSYIKNHASFKDEYTNSYLGWVAHVAGKRESRRLIGDFVLREQDLVDFTIYPDGCVSTSWYIDNHEPDPENCRHFKEPFLSRGCLRPLDFYPIPYRCFYSKDIDNMFMAGRDISVSHIALGTTRVMRTTAMMGEVVGLAARICRDEGVLPRDIYRKAFDKLQALIDKGAGNPNMPYLQTYTLIDTTAARSEEC